MVIHYMGHGQYLVYSSKSYIFEECIIVFQVLVYKQMLSFFEECIIIFQAPAQFPKNIKMSRILLSINLNFGCSYSVHSLASSNVLYHIRIESQLFLHTCTSCGNMSWPAARQEVPKSRVMESGVTGWWPVVHSGTICF